jgi:hypothetical protein
MQGSGFDLQYWGEGGVERVRVIEKERKLLQKIKKKKTLPNG